MSNENMEAIIKSLTNYIEHLESEIKDLKFWNKFYEQQLKTAEKKQNNDQ